DGLAEMSVAAGLSTPLGLSRTVVADLAAAGDITTEGKALGKSDRLVAGQWLDVTLPAPERDLAAEPPQLVEGMDILYSDDDVIAVNKPFDVDTHPTLC